MSRFKRLTDAEARTLTRRELLDRIEAEQAYWFRKKKRTAEEDAAFREFTRIMYAYLSPASVADAMQDTIDYIEGRSPAATGTPARGRRFPSCPRWGASVRLVQRGTSVCIDAAQRDGAVATSRAL